MSEDRETQSAGSPVEETEASRTDVLAAIQRTRTSEGAAGDTTPEGADSAARSDAADTAAAADTTSAPGEGSAENASAAGATGAAAGGASVSTADGAAANGATANGDAQRLASASLDTQPHLERTAIIGNEELPSAAAPASTPAPTAPAAEPGAAPASSAAFGGQMRDGEIRIDSDHPMAALYMQTPMPPELRGNRGAGTLIALLATVVFALVYAGVLAARLAPVYPASTFLEDGLLPFITSWGFIAATAAFFIGLVFIVLIVGRAGWWAYVLGGFPLAIFVGAAAIFGYALSEAVMSGGTSSWDVLDLLRDFGFTTPVIGAAIVAREVSVWFGAWIGARGRRMKAKNAELLADYDAAMAEARAKKP